MPLANLQGNSRLLLLLLICMQMRMVDAM